MHNRMIVLLSGQLNPNFVFVALADLALRYDFQVLFAQGGRDAARVFARHTLEREQVAMAIVAGASCSGANADDAEAVITRYIAPATQQPYRVVLFKPAFEVVFFETPGFWSALGASLATQIEVVVPGPGFPPGAALDETLRRLKRPNRHWLWMTLQESPEAMELLRAHPAILSIRQFIEQEAREFDPVCPYGDDACCYPSSS